MYAGVYWSSPDLYEGPVHPEDLKDDGARAEARVDSELEPSLADAEAYAFAVESYREHERYGLPYPGGSKDQPYVWHLAVSCVASAVEDARADTAYWGQYMAEQD